MTLLVASTFLTPDPPKFFQATLFTDAVHRGSFGVEEGNHTCPCCSAPSLFCTARLHPCSVALLLAAVLSGCFPACLSQLLPGSLCFLLPPSHLILNLPQIEWSIFPLDHLSLSLSLSYLYLYIYISIYLYNSYMMGHIWVDVKGKYRLTQFVCDNINPILGYLLSTFLFLHHIPCKGYRETLAKV